MYLVFGGLSYYASGGANDLIASIASKEEAIELAKSCIGGKAFWVDEFGKECSCTIEWTHVFGIEEGKIAYKSKEEPYGADCGFERVEKNGPK